MPGQTEHAEVFKTETKTAALMRAEVDQQITTAKTYPRSVDRFLTDIERLATLNETVADECIYALPRRDGNDVKMIEGPSARFGELVLAAWKNCRAGARVVDDDGEFITAQGFFHDLESNVAISREVRRRITTSKGQRYSADMIAVTANAACAIAQRNATFAGIPKALWSAAYESARALVAGSAETFVARRGKAVDHLGKMGVPPERIFARLGISGPADMTVDHLVTLRGLTAAIRDNEIDVDEAFPGAVVEKESTAGTATKGMAGLKVKMNLPTTTTAPAPKVEVVDIAVEGAGAQQQSDDARPMCSAEGCLVESELLVDGRPYCKKHEPKPAKVKA